MVTQRSNTMKSDLASYALNSKEYFSQIIEKHVDGKFTLNINYITDGYIDYKYVYFTVTTEEEGYIFLIKLGMYPGCCGGLSTWGLKVHKNYKDLANELIGSIGLRVRRNCITYITNKHQSEIIEFFEEYGWQKADLGINNNSDNRLIMWTYNPNGVKEI